MNLHILVWFRYAVGMLLILFGLAFYLVYHPLALQYLLENHLASLAPLSAYAAIFSGEISLRTQIYIFGITNERAFLQGQKPKLREYGPFAFKIIQKRRNITWFQDEHLIAYNNFQLFYFEPDKSAAGLQDFEITVVNLPFLAVMNKLLATLQDSSVLRLVSPMINGLTKQILSLYGESLLERRTPHDIIVGRPFKMFDSIRSMLQPFAGYSDAIVEGLKRMPAKIGFLSERNNTVVGTYVLRTGKRTFRQMWNAFGEEYGRHSLLVQSIDQLVGIKRKVKQPREPVRKPADYYTYKNKLVNDIYPSPMCNQIEGQEGSLYDNLAVRRREHFELYLPICKKISLVHDKRIYFNGNLPIEQYTFDPYAFSVQKYNNWCYCPHCVGDCVQRQKKRTPLKLPQVQLTNSTRLPEGNVGDRMLQKCEGYHDLEACVEAPLLFTYPHFLYAHNLLSLVGSGLKPSIAKHKTLFNIDPLTGLAVGAYAKFQLNVRLDRMRSLSGFENIGSDIIPFIWFNEGSEPSPDEKKQLIQMLTFFYGFKNVGLVLILFGLILLLWASVKLVKLLRAQQIQRRKSSYLENNDKPVYVTTNKSQSISRADTQYHSHGSTMSRSNGKVVTSRKRSMTPVEQ